MVQTVVLHGVESTGKSTLAAELAHELGTIWVPEYGRSHCQVHGVDLAPQDFATIAAAQSAMIDAARRWSGPTLLADTDWLMTCAWHKMMLGHDLACPAYRLADLYLLLAPDVAWVDDGTRLFGEEGTRNRFAALCRARLEQAGVRFVEISGSWDERLSHARQAVATL
jgi:NadR type nicotinamide-nucleotide adenylyltransferase